MQNKVNKKSLHNYGNSNDLYCHSIIIESFKELKNQPRHVCVFCRITTVLKRPLLKDLRNISELNIFLLLSPYIYTLAELNLIINEKILTDNQPTMLASLHKEERPVNIF